MQVIVTEPIHAVPLNILCRQADVVRWDDPGAGDWSRADAVIVRAAAVTRGQIQGAPRLKVIGKHGVGVNAIDVAAAREAGVAVVYTPAANTDSVAELVVGLALSVARKVGENMAAIRAGAERIVPPELTGLELGGKTLGLVGLGRIALRVAEICRRGFGMAVAGYDPFVGPERCRELGIERHDSVDSLLAASDLVSVSVPYTPDTHHLIGAAQFEHFRPDAILVNTARGGVVDETALCRALAAGRLAGAACDVFEQEPPRPDNPLLAFPNFVGSLHVGASTQEALLRVGNTVVADVLAVLSGQKPRFPFVS